jgi:hypothetical protein
METHGVDLRKCDRSALGHAWYDVDDDGAWTTWRVFWNRDVAECERCRSRRYTCIDHHGFVVARWYARPTGWKERWGVGGGRPSGREIRVMMAQKRIESRRTP